jgi:hypothetical protein
MTTCNWCRWLVMTCAAPVLRQARRSWAERGGPNAKARSAITAPSLCAKTGPTGRFFRHVQQQSAAEPASEPDFDLVYSLRVKALVRDVPKEEARAFEYAAYRSRHGVGLDAAKQAVMAALKGEKRK